MNSNHVQFLNEFLPRIGPGVQTVVVYCHAEFDEDDEENEAEAVENELNTMTWHFTKVMSHLKHFDHLAKLDIQNMTYSNYDLVPLLEPCKRTLRDFMVGSSTVFVAKHQSIQFTIDLGALLQMCECL